MVKGKLILICQCGGEFSKNNDGSLTYNGGEAQAVNIDSETLFDDLKLKLAELCNLDFKSVVVKYFLPGNTRTLINMSNDKELKRMLDFHGKSVTAEVFVTGTVGFDRDAVNLETRENSIRVAESATRAAVPTPASPVDPAPTPDAPAKEVTKAKKGRPGRKKGSTNQKKPTPEHTDTPVTRSAKSKLKAKSPAGRKRKHIDTESATAVDATLDSAATGTTAANVVPDDSGSDFSDFALRSLVTGASKRNARTPVEMDMDANPADTVKKRRRVASSKARGNGTAVVTTLPDDGMSKSGSKKKSRKRKHQQDLVVHEELDDKSDDDDDDYEASFADDMALGKILSSWKKGIKNVGQVFTDAAEFRDILQKYAFARRFVYKLKKNEATRVSARCTIESCSWKLLACWVPTEDVFKVMTFNKTHSCNGESWRSPHPNRKLIVNFIREKLRNSPHQKVKDIANSLSRDFGLELNLSQVRRGINDAREQLQGSYQEAYNQLPVYCDQILQANPDSVVKLETNEEKRLKHLFISFGASIHGFENGCRPLIFLEASSMKSKCKEKLLTATALDGNDGLFPVAFAIVDNEDNDSWRWFLEMLRSAVPNAPGPLTFVSDREKGLKEVVLGVFNDSHIGYSIYHLLQRFMRSVKRPFQGQGRSSLPGFFIAAAQTIRFSVFRTFVEKIMKVSPEAYEWLMQVEPEYWASTSFKGEPYNHITQNVAESYVKLMEEKRETTITHKLEALVSTLSKLIDSRKTVPDTWTSKLTPPKQDKLREEFNEARGLKVLFSSDTIFEVRAEVSHVVNLDITDCTCLVWRRTGIPCRHAIAVFNCTNRNTYDYCSAYYTKDSYILTYSKSITLVDRPAEKEESEADAVLMLPPQLPRPWSSQLKRRLTKTEASSAAGPEGVGEGNLIAAFDANGQVHDDHHDHDYGANGEDLLEDCHEVVIEGDVVASLDSVVDVVCEVVNHEVAADTNQEITAESNSVAAVDDIGKGSGEEDDMVTSIEDINAISLDDNGEGRFEIDHDLFGDANYNNVDSLEIDLESDTHEVGIVDVNLDDSFKTTEVNEEAIDENDKGFHEGENNESFYEATGKDSLDAVRENDETAGENV